MWTFQPESAPTLGEVAQILDPDEKHTAAEERKCWWHFRIQTPLTNT